MIVRNFILGLSLAFAPALFPQTFAPSVLHEQSNTRKNIESQLATEERLREPGWWPTRRDASRNDFIGSAACINCHRAIGESQAATPMAQAAATAVHSRVLRQRGNVATDAGAYSYSIVSSGAESRYSVRAGAAALTVPLSWAFGLGNKGQTFVYKRGDRFFESRMSFYASLQNLALTTGHSLNPPADLEAALGQPISVEPLRKCFGCHTTGSDAAEGFDPDQATPGVGCESCHGPGGRHATLMSEQNLEEGRQAIFNPVRLGPVALVDFCGACHRTWSDVNEMNLSGVANVRFQPYRLENSRCWGNGDARLSCLACHDPHKQVVKDSSFYDAKCLACHASGRQEKPRPDRPGKACPVKQKGCANCHMPKVLLPSMYSTFVDHEIRVVKPHANYPD